MGKCKGLVLCFLITLMLPAACLELPAQDYNSLSLGTFHSPKGIGVSLEIQHEDESFDCIGVIADLHSVLNGRFSKPGLKASYHRNMLLGKKEKEGYKMEFYAGPGVTAGFVRDINEPMSLVAGLSGCVGGRAFFPGRRLSINLELAADLAFEVNRNNRFGKIDLSIYKSGIYHLFYPQLRIQYHI